MTTTSMDDRISLAYHRLEECQRSSESARKMNKDEFFKLPCRICSEFLYILSFPAHDRIELELGTLQQLRESGCKNHDIIFPFSDTLLKRTICLRRPTIKPLIYVYPDPARFNGSNRPDAAWELLDDQDKNKRLFGEVNERAQPRVVDDNWIDLKMLRAWGDECETKHCTHCADPSSSLSANSYKLILVDVFHKCLVSNPPSGRYVALSYVWGTTNRFVTTQARFQKLTEPGALEQSQTSRFKLPKTIAQAIQLVGALGERYLWVDSLCIVQDGDDKADQLDAMASIYTNAVLTIVVASGKGADDGMQGLRGISTPRRVTQHIAPLSPRQKVMRPSSKHIWDENMLQPWASRGWTFQEAICSRRLLIFANGSVRWSCRTAQWSEESNSADCIRTYGITKLSKVRPFAFQISSSTLPSLGEFENIVSGFNVRKFTYSEDAYYAFAGVSTQLATKFCGALICGLPEVFFDICLLWRPLRRIGPAQRRRSDLTPGHPDLPSWSWMGWETDVSFPYTWNHNSDPVGPLPMMLGRARARRPTMIECSDEPQDESKVAIQHTWLSFANEALDEQLPTGWRPRKASKAFGSTGFDSLARDYERLGGEVSFFKHEDDPSLEFCFPVPLCDQPQRPTLRRYLHFDTCLARCKLGEVRGTMTRIHRLDGTPMGTLWQHDEEDDDFKLATTGPMDDRPVIELIQMIGSFIPKRESVTWDVDEVLEGHSLHNNTEARAFELVWHVLWIQWDGNIAYRKATGVVDDEIWDASDLSQVKVVLG